MLGYLYVYTRKSSRRTSTRLSLSFLGPSEFPYVLLCQRDFTAEDFTADITERASSEFGAGYRDHISPLLQDQFNYMPTQDTRDWANRFFSITDSRHIPSAYRNSIPWARSESTFYRCNSYEYSLYYSLYRSSKPIFASPL